RNPPARARSVSQAHSPRLPSLIPSLVRSPHRRGPRPLPREAPQGASVQPRLQVLLTRITPNGSVLCAADGLGRNRQRTQDAFGNLRSVPGDGPITARPRRSWLTMKSIVYGALAAGLALAAVPAQAQLSQDAQSQAIDACTNGT